VPIGLEGSIQGKEKFASIVLEALFDNNLWCWSSAFGYPGALNDITILERGPLFSAFLQEKIPEMEFTVSGERFTKPIIVTDGIYPELAMFSKTMSVPTTPEESRYAGKQEAVQKGVERGFGGSSNEVAHPGNLLQDDGSDSDQRYCFGGMKWTCSIFQYKKRNTPLLLALLISF
jgi:hypothetical protein